MKLHGQFPRPQELPPPRKTPCAWREAMAATGFAARTIGAERAGETRNRAIGRVKCVPATTTHPGQWRPYTKPAGANGAQHTNPGE